MLTNESFKDEIPYNLIATFVFIGIVVGLPIFFYLTGAFFYYSDIPLIFGAWTFLREADIKIKHRKMVPLSSKHPDIANQIINLPAYINLKKKPVIMYIPTEVPEVFAFGTWQKKYIAISEGAINRWGETATITSVITHEIAHIANGDIWKTGYSLHFLYWFFGVNIFIFIRTFPYSLFFKIYTSFRLTNGYTDLITSLTLFILIIAVLLATRILYRMKEYSADAFAAKHIGVSDYVKAFVAPISKNKVDYKKASTSKTYFQELLFRTFRFHPSSQARLTALQSPHYLLTETPSLMFVIGIFIGVATCYFLDLDTSFALVLIAEITFGFISIATLLNFQKSTHKPLIGWKNYIENTFSLANGVAIAFLVLVGVNNLLVNQNDGAYGFLMVIRKGVDLRDALFSAIDVLSLILFLIPVLILGFIFVAWLLIKICSINGYIWKPSLLSITSLIPVIILFDFHILQWWKGQTISIDIVYLFLPTYIFWIVVVISIWRLVSHRQNKLGVEGV